MPGDILECSRQSCRYRRSPLCSPETAIPLGTFQRAPQSAPSPRAVGTVSLQRELLRRRGHNSTIVINVIDLKRRSSRHLLCRISSGPNPRRQKPAPPATPSAALASCCIGPPLAGRRSGPLQAHTDAASSLRQSVLHMWPRRICLPRHESALREDHLPVLRARPSGGFPGT